MTPRTLRFLDRVRMTITSLVFAFNHAARIEFLQSICPCNLSICMMRCIVPKFDILFFGREKRKDPYGTHFSFYPCR